MTTKETIEAIDCPVNETVQRITNAMLSLETVFDAIQGDLGYLELICKDDNAKELVMNVKSRIAKIADNCTNAIFEADGDWQNYSLRGVIDLLVTDSKETLLIPNIRKNFQEIVGDDFTEEMFQEHLVHVRQQFNLGKDFS